MDSKKIKTLFVINCDWGETNCDLMYYPPKDFYYLKFDSLVIVGCPSNEEEIDMLLIKKGMKCFFDMYGECGNMIIPYEGLEEEVEKIYASFGY